MFSWFAIAAPRQVENTQDLEVLPLPNPVPEVILLPVTQLQQKDIRASNVDELNTYPVRPKLRVKPVNLQYQSVTQQGYATFN